MNVICTFTSPGKNHLEINNNQKAANEMKLRNVSRNKCVVVIGFRWPDI